MRARARTVAVSALVVAVLVIAACGSGNRNSTTTTTPKTGSSIAPPTSVPATQQPDSAIWPFAASTLGYPDPVVAARTFAVTYLGFVDPVVGAYQPGDSRSGEVDVRPSATGPVTTVLVRMLTPANTWWVIGASTPNIRMESPTALAAISSPVVLSGQSNAFEATVNVQIRQDGTLTPLKEDIVMGGANGVMGPFSKSIVFSHPAAGAGAIVLKTISARDGNIWEASVVRVSFSS